MPVKSPIEEMHGSVRSMTVYQNMEMPICLVYIIYSGDIRKPPINKLGCV